MNVQRRSAAAHNGRRDSFSERRDISARPPTGCASGAPCAVSMPTEPRGETGPVVRRRSEARDTQGLRRPPARAAATSRARAGAGSAGRCGDRALDQTASLISRSRNVVTARPHRRCRGRGAAAPGTRCRRPGSGGRGTGWPETASSGPVHSAVMQLLEPILHVARRQ